MLDDKRVGPLVLLAARLHVRVLQGEHVKVGKLLRVEKKKEGVGRRGKGEVNENSRAHSRFDDGDRHPSAGSHAVPRHPLPTPHLEVLLAAVEVAGAVGRQRVRHGQQLAHGLQLAPPLVRLAVHIGLVALLLQDRLRQRDQLLETRLPVRLARRLLAQLLVDQLDDAVVVLQYMVAIKARVKGTGKSTQRQSRAPDDANAARRRKGEVRTSAMS